MEQVATLSLREAITLSLDKDPHEMDWSEASGRLAKKHADRLALAKRAAAAGQLKNNPTPREFLAWATTNIIVPSELIERVEVNNKPLVDWESLYESASADLLRAQGIIEEYEKRISDQQNEIERMKVYAIDPDDATVSDEMLLALEIRHEVVQKFDSREKIRPQVVAALHAKGVRRGTRKMERLATLIPWKKEPGAPKTPG